MSALRTAIWAALVATPLLATGEAHADSWREWREKTACYVRVAAQDAPAAFGFFKSTTAGAIFYGEPAGPWTASENVTLQVDDNAPIAAFAVRQTENVISIQIPTEQDRQRLVGELLSGALLTVITSAGPHQFTLSGVDAALAKFDACIKTLPGGDAS